jgi:hypothetical protein
MKKLIATAAVTGLVLAVSFNAMAEEKVIAGEGMCARCELEETDSCQNAIQFKDGDKTVTVYLTHNQVSRDFHRNICKGRKTVQAKGNLQETGGRKELTPTKIDLAKVVKGEGMCARCELEEAASCQNAIQVKEDGKTVTYYLTHNQVSKEFHRNICKGRTPVEAIGTVEEKDGKKELTPAKIELVKQ